MESTGFAHWLVVLVETFALLFVLLLVVVILVVMVVWVLDRNQTHNSVLRNYPVIGHFRYWFLHLGEFFRQYLYSSDREELPFNRAQRMWVYRAAKNSENTNSFGSTRDLRGEGVPFFVNAAFPSLGDHHVEPKPVRIGPYSREPYDHASFFNISAMSFGALSPNAVRALNAGAKKGGFAHDTGEGGVSPYHRENGGDIIWEIGSGYFGCRHSDGSFNPDKFAEVAANDQIKMIEIKLSQGAKPGHGGVLPGAKVTSEIAAIRGVEEGKDCLSPASHSAFSTPIEMMRFIGELRRLSQGKPVGFKLCLGHAWEFLAICKAMLETKIYPDFIVVDGKEGGTGAAPLEFMDHLGMPMREGLVFVHNALVGIGARNRIRIGAAGKIVTAFDIARAMALGADWCNSARGFMFSLGCIQSLSCHTDRCPTGVATQDPTRSRALVVPDKSERVHNFHRSTIHALAELTAAAGLDHPSDFHPVHFWRRVNVREATTFAEIYPSVETGELVSGARDEGLRKAWSMASVDSFRVAM